MPRHDLSTEQVQRYHDQGFLGPFTAFSPDEMAKIRSYIESNVLESDDGPFSNHPLQDRHRDHERIYEMFAQPPIMNRIRSILGDDLLLWASYFWNKEPGGAEIPWHQDASDFINFLHPPVSISAWIAIDEVTKENSCVKLIPESNRDIVPLIDAPDDARFEMMADPDEFDTESAVSMELEPGQFFLFSNWTVHGSEANCSDERRLGASMRVTPSFVDIDYVHCYEGYKAVQLCGKSKPPINKLAQPVIE